MSISSSTTTEKLSLAPSLASIIRSHVAVHVGGEINPSAHFSAPVSVVENTEVDIVEVESVEVPDALASEELEVSETRVMGPVRPVLPVEESIGEEDDVADIDVETESPSAVEEVDAEVESDVVEEIDAEVEEEDDLDLDIDVSAYLTGNTPATEDFEESVAAAAVETVAPEVEEEQDDDSIEVEEDLSVDEEDDDPDLDGFNPMKYLSGGGGSSQPAPKVQEAPAKPNVGVVAARQADPMSLLRELSTLSR